jgi:hypothetical protein
MACFSLAMVAPVDTLSANICPPGICTHKIAHAHKIFDFQVTLLIQIPGSWMIKAP